MRPLFYVVFALLLGCNTSSDEPKNQRSESAEKISINEEMKPHVSRSSELIQGFEGTTREEYQSLEGQLSQTNEQIISSCTMEGHDHEVLHEWLHPHLELVKRLSTTQDLDSLHQIVEELQRSDREFHERFK